MLNKLNRRRLKLNKAQIQTKIREALHKEVQTQRKIQPIQTLRLKKAHLMHKMIRVNIMNRLKQAQTLKTIQIPQRLRLKQSLILKMKKINQRHRAEIAQLQRVKKSNLKPKANRNPLHKVLRVKQVLQPLILKPSRAPLQMSKMMQVHHLLTKKLSPVNHLLKTQVNQVVLLLDLRINKIILLLIPKINLLQVNKAQAHQIILQVLQVKGAVYSKIYKTILCMLEASIQTMPIGRVLLQSLTTVSIGLLIYHLQAVLKLNRKLTAPLRSQ